MMSTTRQSQQDSFTDGLSKYAEAARHGMTASRLAAAGTMALGAATYFYFADADRREAAISAATRMFEGVSNWWESAVRGQPMNDGRAGGANPGAATAPPPGTAA
jgi:hypothetical protein